MSAHNSKTQCHFKFASPWKLGSQFEVSKLRSGALLRRQLLSGAGGAERAPAGGLSGERVQWAQAAQVGGRAGGEQRQRVGGKSRGEGALVTCG